MVHQQNVQMNDLKKTINLQDKQIKTYRERLTQAQMNQNNNTNNTQNNDTNNNQNQNNNDSNNLQIAKTDGLKDDEIIPYHLREPFEKFLKATLAQQQIEFYQKLQTWFESTVQHRGLQRGINLLTYLLYIFFL